MYAIRSYYGRRNQHEVITTDMSDKIAGIAKAVLDRMNDLSGHFDQLTAAGVAIAIVKCLEIVEIEITRITSYNVCYTKLLRET